MHLHLRSRTSKRRGCAGSEVVEDSQKDVGRSYVPEGVGGKSIVSSRAVDVLEPISPVSVLVNTDLMIEERRIRSTYPQVTMSSGKSR